MPQVPSVMSLHLRYRLLIAELNYDINVLRIFDDYAQEIKTKRNEPEVKKDIALFEKEFTALRNEIDELRHEMHLQKMKLASLARAGKNMDSKTYKSDNHSSVWKRYTAYRKNFNSVRNEFGRFEGRWL